MAKDIDTVLKIQNLKRSFGGKTVLDIKDLKIPRGKFVVILGNSGCGKTTFLETIGLMSHPTEAEALLLTDFPYADQPITDNDYDLFAAMVKHFRSVRRIGSAALELAYVACGRADVAFLGLGSAWDVAAGMMLIEQAGGQYLPIERLATGMWPPSRCVATCAGFDVEQSVLKTLVG